jgi:putative acetyltransferase
MTDRAKPAIAVESPLQADVRRLIDAAHAYSASLYPAASNHYLATEALAGPDVTFLVARLGGQAVGTGALKAHDATLGEIKQMWVEPACRGQAIGRLLLQEIERRGRALGLTRLALETGIRQPEAIALYRNAGYGDCEPFADYRPDPLSVFMAKALRATAAPA